MACGREGAPAGAVCVPVPEMVICDYATECKVDCYHKEKHLVKESIFCFKPCGGLNGAVANASCVPYVEPDAKVEPAIQEYRCLHDVWNVCKFYHDCRVSKYGYQRVVSDDKKISACMWYEREKPAPSGPFFCYVEGRNSPKYLWDNYDLAKKEAIRLASLPDNVGGRVHVLASTGFYKATPVAPKVEWHEVQPIKWTERR